MLLLLLKRQPAVRTRGLPVSIMLSYVYVCIYVQVYLSRQGITDHNVNSRQKWKKE